MNRIRLTITMCGAALLLAPCRTQAQSAQTQNDMSPVEFRQTLMDLGSFLDARKGTDLRRQFEAIPDDFLGKMLSAVPDPRQLQSAVESLKAHGAMGAAQPGAPMMNGKVASIRPEAVVGMCAPNSIIDNSPGAQCTPAYPDPNNSSWQTMVNALNTSTVGAFSPGPGASYSAISPQGCGLTTEINLQQVTVAFQGLLNSLGPVCSIIPAPVNAACLIPLTAIAVTDSVSAGLYSDCIEQDGLVNAAEIDAGFHNTVTIFNNLNTGFSSLGTQLTNVNSQITGEFSALGTQVTNVDNHIAAEFTALDAHLVTLVNQLSNQIGQETALLGADLKQVMKLELTPSGRRVINPAILTCTGSNCPNVLAACPAAGCSWNDVGPLP